MKSFAITKSSIEKGDFAIDRGTKLRFRSERFASGSKRASAAANDLW